MNNTAKILTIWFLMGTFYYVLEGIWRIPQGGYANISMLTVGGACGLLIGSINQIPKFYNLKIIYQALIGTAITVIIELISGIILNIKLGLHIWDYSDLPFTILDQVCLPFTILWFLLMPLAIWLEDIIRYILFDEGEEYTLFSIYKDFITFK